MLTSVDFVIFASEDALTLIVYAIVSVIVNYVLGIVDDVVVAVDAVAADTNDWWGFHLPVRSTGIRYPEEKSETNSVASKEKEETHVDWKLALYSLRTPSWPLKLVEGLRALHNAEVAGEFVVDADLADGSAASLAVSPAVSLYGMGEKTEIAVAASESVLFLGPADFVVVDLVAVDYADLFVVACRIQKDQKPKKWIDCRLWNDDDLFAPCQIVPSSAW